MVATYLQPRQPFVGADSIAWYPVAALYTGWSCDTLVVFIAARNGVKAASPLEHKANDEADRETLCDVTRFSWPLALRELTITGCFEELTVRRYEVVERDPPPGAAWTPGAAREPRPPLPVFTRAVLCLRYLLFQAKVDDEDVGGSAWERWSRMMRGRQKERWLPRERFALSNAWELWLLLHVRLAADAPL